MSHLEVHIKVMKYLSKTSEVKARIFIVLIS